MGRMARAGVYWGARQAWCTATEPKTQACTRVPQQLLLCASKLTRLPVRSVVAGRDAAGWQARRGMCAQRYNARRWIQLDNVQPGRRTRAHRLRSNPPRALRGGPQHSRPRHAHLQSPSTRLPRHQTRGTRSGSQTSVSLAPLRCNGAWASCGAGFFLGRRFREPRESS